MYYSSGNYEAFARPKKPAGVDGKSAYIIGTGLAALSAACYLVRDAQMPGKNIHILEKDAVAGGACDGADIPGLGYVMRGGREMDNHFEVMWDLFRSIPSIETEGVSVLDEYYWLNKDDPNYSLCRATKDRGVPEVWGSVYDVRNLLNATVKLRDGSPVTDMKLNVVERAVMKKVLKKLGKTDIGMLLREYGAI